MQDFLDGLRYACQPIYRSPRRVLRDSVAHCVDGALLAAAAFRHHGRPPLVLWIDAENDDGHLITLFRDASPRTEGRAHHPRRAERAPAAHAKETPALWGAVAKSNVVGLRWREPVYRSVRELVMSYFDEYFNLIGERTMRSYRTPMDLSRHDDLAWMTDEAGLETLLDLRLERRRRVSVLPRFMSPSALRPVDPRRLKAGLIGSQRSGLFRPQ